MKIEQYIQENKTLFNEGSLPEGHQQRFLEKLQAAEQKQVRLRRSVKLVRTLLSAAAVVALALLIPRALPFAQKDYMALMLEEEEAVIQLLSQSDPFTRQQMSTALESITFEAIPLQELLPEELPSKQQQKILQAYYKQKVEGIQELKKSINTNK